MKNGHRQKSIQGDSLQQGGAMIVTTAGEIILHHANQTGGDHVAIAELMKHLESQSDS